MCPQHVVQASNAFGKDRRVESQVNHTDVGFAKAKNQVAEIAVIGDQNALFPNRNREDFHIREVPGFVTTDALDVMAEQAQMLGEPGIGTGIDQEFHGRPAVPAGWPRSRSTAARA